MVETSVAVKINQLMFRYASSTSQILDSFSLDVGSGAFVGIIGPNGCGKTTLLKCITRVLPPEAGLVEVLGTDAAELNRKELAKRLGVVPQRFEASFSFTGRELVAMGRYPHQKLFNRESAADKRKIEDALTVTNTLHLADRPITQLSGGELQRITIAQALAQEPQVLLLDEATSNLDINHQVEILDLIRELNRTQGLTVISVMHDLNLAAQYCDFLVMMKDGQVYASGSPIRVLTRKAIRDVYGAHVSVRVDPVTKRPQVGAISRSGPSYSGSGFLAGTRVHVIGGGGMAASLLELLVGHGLAVSCGVINALDGDWLVANDLGIPMVTEAAFASIQKSTHHEHLGMAAQADVIVVANIPFGAGNLLNLEAAQAAQDSGKPVVLCDFTPVEARDFTEGKAERLHNRLLEHGAVSIREIEDLWDVLSQLVTDRRD